MANIKIGELRETLKNNKKEDIKEVDYHGLKLEIKQFITVQEKINLVASAFESAIDRENGLHLINYNNLDVAYKIFVVQKYTNITLPKDSIQAYDLLCESGLYDFIYNNIPTEEKVRLEVALDNHINAERDKYEQNLKLEKIIKDGINGLLTRLDKFVESMPTIEEMEKMPNLVTDIYKQMQSGIANLTGKDKEYAETVTKVALEDVSRIG